jgi:hypothetical protein
MTPEEPTSPDDVPPVPPPIPPHVPPRRVEPLNYVRPGLAWRDDERRPFIAGFGIGIGLTLFTLMVMGWMLTRMGLRSWWAPMVVVPCAALVVAAVLEGLYGFRGIIAGVGFTLGMLVLLGCVGVWILCGGMR